MFLVDSSVWIDYFNGTVSPQTDRLDEALGVEPLLVGDLMLAEVLQGFRAERHYRIARELILDQHSRAGRLRDGSRCVIPENAIHRDRAAISHLDAHVVT